eukprot:GFUD01053325.1.p1 GENE.GFUD01053325.1~~GFUD01053325.1.p1  ORF type:complete len:346 (+),score=49.89 GFUD01053325.1:303-1340(+)
MPPPPVQQRYLLILSTIRRGPRLVKIISCHIYKYIQSLIILFASYARAYFDNQVVHLHDCLPLKNGENHRKLNSSFLSDWNDARYNCDQCLLQISGISPLEHMTGSRHLEIIKETQKCPFCDKVIFSEFLDEHKEEFHDGAMFRCAFGEDCREKFLSIEQVENHIKSKHTDSVDTESSLFIILPETKLMCKFQCNMCAFSHCASYTDMKQHLKNHRNEESFKKIHVIFKCRVCEKDFETLDAVIVHSKSHEKEYGSLRTRIIAKESSLQSKKEVYKENRNKKQEINVFVNTTENRFGVLGKKEERCNKNPSSPMNTNLSYPAKIPCIFWNRGFCRNENYCKFQHD